MQGPSPNSMGARREKSVFVRCSNANASARARQVRLSANTGPCGESARRRALLWIFVGERLRIFVVGEQLAIATQKDDRPQRAFGVVFRHIVLELLAKSGRRRPMARALVEHALDMEREWNVGEQLL